MAYPAAPQPFTFTAGTAQLTLTEIESFTGKTPRRSVTHEYPKRPGGREEDMDRGSRTLQVRLQFIGPTAASDFEAFESAVDANPSGLLSHPVHGQFFAFCKGPDYNVDFLRAINQIECTVVFIESQLDATVAADPPDVATAAQNATGQLAAAQQTIATFMGALSAAQTQAAGALNALQTAVSQLAAGVSAPVDFMFTAATQVQGLQASVIAALETVQLGADTLTSDVTSFVAAATDLYNGNDTTPSGSSDSIAALLGIVQGDGQALIATLIAASPTPAGAADAVADVSVLLDYCYTLSDAVAAAQPPVISYTVPFDGNLIVLAQHVIEQANANVDATSYASAILGLNRISNPALIPSGTILNIPSLS